MGKAKPQFHLAGSPEKPAVKRDPPPALATGRAGRQQPRNTPVVKLRPESHGGGGGRSQCTNDTKERALELTLRKELGTTSRLFVLGDRSNFIAHTL